jgi:signal transduction histidine kinase
VKHLKHLIKNMHPQGARHRFTHLVIVFTLMFSVILAVTLVIVTAGLLLLNALGAITLPDSSNAVVAVIIWALASLCVGVITASLLSHIPLRPFQFLIDGMNRLAQGDYSVRLHIGHFAMIKKLNDSFNALAAELQNTEMLRTDFVNNFSHEFKTPIVSMMGFAKLLKRKDIPPEKREEYLDIIISESKRLTDMATNVLNLAKIENQSILTDVTTFNLSEQIRNCILLLQKQWEGKRLEMDFDEHEHRCTGNEELLQQVWINLLDNAVKYAPEESHIKVGITMEPAFLSVFVANAGDPIGKQAQERIFEKFYQGDSSRATEGMGLGLAIVRKIVELHNGTIEVTRVDGYNVFTVHLPQVQEGLVSD